MDKMVREDGRFLDKSMFDNDRKVSMKTVDSFQGMERSIVLLSMTRSNRNNDVGFFKMNRE